MMSKTFTNLFILTILMNSATTKSQTLQTVSSMDLKKQCGKWYEIASYPQRFQKSYNCTTAKYTLSEKGFVIVENRCNKNSVDGQQFYIKGKEFVENNLGNTKLKVQFFWPFTGKYWIINLADDYSYAVVSHPNKKYLLILSRTPKMNYTIYPQILSQLKENDFDLLRLKNTTQI